MTTSGGFRARHPSRVFRYLVPVVAAVAGFLAATAAASSHGAPLPGQRDDLPGLVAAHQASEQNLDREARALRAEIDARTAASATGSERVRAAEAQQTTIGEAAGLTAVSGPGVTVALDDAPRSARNRPLPRWREIMGGRRMMQCGPLGPAARYTISR